ncbi:MAG: cytochrome c3 family protein [Gordonibacter sp.]|uniref:hypothetical protein n=1 Tax=Gordonibacter sp. TaxID=1968902 RepID=UPI002FCBC56F
MTEESSAPDLEQILNDAPSTTDSINAVDTPPAPKRKKPLLIALGVIVVVLIVAGAGAWVWHAQPSFCGAVCHNTMGSYLASYETGHLLAKDHADAAVKCLDCHEADLGAQVQELQAQLSGDYKLPLAKMKVDDSFCLQEGCHAREEIENATSNYTADDGTRINVHAMTFNSDYGATESPHQIEGSTLACSNCHNMHRTSEKLNYCYSCHHTEKFDACYECHDHR